MKKLSVFMKGKGWEFPRRLIPIILVILSFLTVTSVSAFQKAPSVGISSLGQEQIAASSTQGKFKVMYFKVKSPAHSQIQKDLKDAKAFESIAGELNKFMVLPRDVTINLGACGIANAYYTPKNHSITMCYELMQYFQKLFSKEFKTQDEIDDATIGTTLFTFFHEMGHALISELGLPATGREEDAVDQLSTVFLTQQGEEGADAPFYAAFWFGLEAAKPQGRGEVPFWDEHSLNIQRFYDIVCLLYGSNSKKYDRLIKDIEFPRRRSIKCKGEYEKISNSWFTLIAPYVRQ